MRSLLWTLVAAFLWGCPPLPAVTSQHGDFVLTVTPERVNALDIPFPAREQFYHRKHHRRRHRRRARRSTAAVHKQQGDGGVHYNLRIHGRKFRLDLVPESDFLAPSAIIQHLGVNRTWVEEPDRQLVSISVAVAYFSPGFLRRIQAKIVLNIPSAI